MKLWMILLAAGAALEIAHHRVFSGAAGGDSNSVASIEGTLANLDETTGANLRLSFILFGLAAFLYFRRRG